MLAGSAAAAGGPGCHLHATRGSGIVSESGRSCRLRRHDLPGGDLYGFSKGKAPS